MDPHQLGGDILCRLLTRRMSASQGGNRRPSLFPSRPSSVVERRTCDINGYVGQFAWQPTVWTYDILATCNSLVPNKTNCLVRGF
eukprot:787476-Amphidinium_carterae.1